MGDVDDRLAAWADLVAGREERRRQHERDMMITHRDGVSWFDAPIPRRWHRCTAQTRALVQGVERCACGAIRYIDDPVWMERNSSRSRKRAH